MVTRIQMTAKDGLMLTHEKARGLGSNTAQDLAGGIDNVPIPLDITYFRAKRFHWSLPAKDANS
jgi:hypothetical protein